MFLFILKEHPENFTFLILRTLELFSGKVCKFFKKWAHFKQILLFVNVYKQTFHISHVCIPQKVKDVLM